MIEETVSQRMLLLCDCAAFPQFEGHKECAVFMGNTKGQVDYLCRWLEEKSNR